MKALDLGDHLPPVGGDPKILVPVRVQLQQAEEKLQIACKLLRENGWPENADDLSQILKSIRVWTMRDGRLGCLANP